MRPRPITKFAGVSEASVPSSANVAATGEPTDLVEGAGIEQCVDPLAYGQLAERPVLRDLLRAAHLGGERAPARQLFELRFPGHAASRNISAASVPAA